MEFENPQKDTQPAAPSPDENVYNELKGYFPEQYDLTPRELEESIRQRRNDFKEKRTKKSVMRSQYASAPKPIAPVPPAEPVKSVEEDLEKYAPAEPDISIWDDDPAEEAEKDEQKSPLLRFFSDAFEGRRFFYERHLTKRRISDRIRFILYTKARRYCCSSKYLSGSGKAS